MPARQLECLFVIFRETNRHISPLIVGTSMIAEMSVRIVSPISSFLYHCRRCDLHKHVGQLGSQHHLQVLPITPSTMATNKTPTPVTILRAIHPNRDEYFRSVASTRQDIKNTESLVVKLCTQCSKIGSTEVPLRTCSKVRVSFRKLTLLSSDVLIVLYVYHSVQTRLVLLQRRELLSNRVRRTYIYMFWIYSARN